MVEIKDGVYGFCECRKQKQIERNIKSAMVDKTFADATFENFKVLPHTGEMYKKARFYTENFDTIRKERQNGLAFMAKVGESFIREERNLAARLELKAKHNSYGLGKTHLQCAIAMTLLKRGVQVLMVNDSDIVAELRNGQFATETDYFENKIQRVESAELLIWDDLGKAKTTEWVLNQYYRIFNYRYRNGLPTCFSTNEDLDSLSERIGDATASRLYAICKGRIVACEGPDYRLRN